MNGKIGIFDSGVGGLTVARAILNLLPNESLLYFADTKHIPYGEHSPREVESFAMRITSFLVQMGVKLLAIACNYSSALIYEKAKELYPDIPIVGVLQEGAKLSAHSPYRKLGILATKGTVRTRIYPKEVKKINPLKEVVQASCPPLVSLIESLAPEESIRPVLKNCLKRLKSKKIEALVLGCTHYPLVRALVEEELGENIVVLDPAEETARTVKKILKERNLLSNSPPNHKFFASGSTTSLRTLVPMLIGGDIIDIEHIEFW